MDSREKPTDRGQTYHSVKDIRSYSHGVIIIRLEKNLNDICLARLEIHDQNIDNTFYSFISYNDFAKTVNSLESRS